MWHQATKNRGPKPENVIKSALIVFLFTSLTCGFIALEYSTCSSLTMQHFVQSLNFYGISFCDYSNTILAELEKFSSYLMSNTHDSRRIHIE